MKISEIIELAERLKQYDKLKQLSDFASHGAFPNALTITVKKGTTTRSMTLTAETDIEDFLTRIDESITKIERKMEELNIGE